MADKNQKLAQEILDAVGGEENIVNSTHCATRLRLVLKRSISGSNKKVSEIDGVVTVVENNGQFQVVIGNNVGEVFKHFEALTGDQQSTSNESGDNKGSILNRIIATMSAVFAPFIYILAAAGILQGLLIVINLIAPAFKETGTYEVFNFMSWAPFTFLPIFIAMTAARHFNVNVYIAVACTAALVSPDLAGIVERIQDGESIKLLGVPLTETSYTSSVLPPLFLVWILSYVEKYLNKWIDDVVKPLFTPFLSIVIMVPITLLIIGPITTIAAHGIASGFNYLVDVAPWLAGALIGGLWQIFVIFGVHWGITPMVLANFEQHKSDAFQAFQTIAVISQIGAVIGVLIKAKRTEIKRVASSAGITGIFGITEPAMYGINLRFKKPFIIACISGAIGAFVASFFNPKYYAYAGLPGPITIVNGYSADNPTSIWGILIGSAIAIILPIVLIQFLGFGDDTTEEVENPDEKTNMDTPGYNLDNNLETKAFTPISGEIVPLSKVNDPIFAEGMMGEGIAIKPNEQTVHSPFNGTVSMVAVSKHAIGITSTTGVEVLIHVGLDTVQLNGEGFNILISENDHVIQGQPILEFNRKTIEDGGFDTIIPIIITNSGEFNEIISSKDTHASLDETLLTIINK
ncbi:PTS beta-glucoside transporter subunit EIIBCA [Staphylococcus saprophyticus]|uniref:beta-glucoside-specific PTS transporter subunit IIABC n=1 Tax=Staphylococcus saprophyticus TaxID=29385 RepID=UPI000D1F9699|nr:beta-glucoside-specific PTS transporter subunit IIABC [Staphylococcus saprophyticus]MBM0845151.1 PTS beta-glucoside transporter subunit EIIBCA [Staphylococcus saprophyticus]MDW4040054.1 beta-glucoside-specific PTS transporter subunit IIABC [Staphylococcus saprophyticus]MDW4049297.1 beta-glucoside-specific PTS transporter subunit IIABC [Staphylococcus saprophyticus]PTJ55237.1 PTS beta-glucoside transporter subunit EIIBCA [Staphylococcus saprophyticus]PTJ69287.1 PTS beta-glucoside transporter